MNRISNRRSSIRGAGPAPELVKIAVVNAVRKTIILIICQSLFPLAAAEHDGNFAASHCNG